MYRMVLDLWSRNKLVHINTTFLIKTNSFVFPQLYHKYILSLKFLAVGVVQGIRLSACHLRVTGFISQLDPSACDTEGDSLTT
jgi:hypothetical protein